MSAPQEPGKPPSLTWRSWQVALAAAFTVAGIGYLTGTRPPPLPERPTLEAWPTETDVAPTYAGLREVKRGANADQYASGLASLRGELPGPFEPVAQTEEDRRRALESRRAHRAYEGAPPTIPHAIDHQALPACLACHSQGLVIAGKVAPRMSHEAYASCTQCHVVEADPRPLQVAVPVLANTFVGLASWGPGERAWPGAPPTMPHPSHMRTECTSCHGTGGRVGLRSTHPYRQSCTQCHPPSAVLDQQPSATLPAMAGGTP
jgi:nitrate reductase (cytochrome), electron transfer subunit